MGDTGDGFTGVSGDQHHRAAACGGKGQAPRGGEVEQRGTTIHFEQDCCGSAMAGAVGGGTQQRFVIGQAQQHQCGRIDAQLG